jgi:hypothetical protein
MQRRLLSLAAEDDDDGEFSNLKTELHKQKLKTFSLGIM